MDYVGFLHTDYRTIKMPAFLYKTKNKISRHRVSCGHHKRFECQLIYIDKKDIESLGWLVDMYAMPPRRKGSMVL
jgi:hypothetical protein